MPSGPAQKDAVGSAAAANHTATSELMAGGHGGGAGAGGEKVVAASLLRTPWFVALITAVGALPDHSLRAFL